MADSPKRTTFISLRVKLLLIFTLLFTAVFAASYYWFYHFATTMAMDRVKQDLSDSLHGGALQVNGDQLVALYQEGTPREDGFTDDPRYWELIGWLDTIHSIEPRAWPYIYVKSENPGEVVFVVDLWAHYDPSKATKFREPYTPQKQFMVQGLSEQAINMSPYTDKWGSWVSGYAPVLNSQGQPVAALGIDFQADYVEQIQQGIVKNVVMAFIAGYAVLFLLVLLASRAFTRPITRLTRAAERIGEGDYEHDFSDLMRGRFRDEISTLAQVFDIMVDKVDRREQTLRRQVEELRIEIDEVKRERQVSEIVESDFFQSLQQKARAARGHMQNPDEGAPAEGPA